MISWTFSAHGEGCFKLSVVSDLGHNHNLLTGEVELFDGFAEYGFRGAIRVHLSMPRSMVHNSPSEGGRGLAKDCAGAHISGVEGLDAVLVTEPIWSRRHRNQ